MKKHEIAIEILKVLNIDDEQGDLSTGSTVTKQTLQKILDKILELINK